MMKHRTQWLTLAALIVGLPMAGMACGDRTIRKQETTTVRRDGETVRTSETVKQRPDGTVVRERERKVEP